MLHKHLLFHSIIANKHHVLQRYLHDNPDSAYNFRPRRHSKTLIDKTIQNSTPVTFYCACYIKVVT